MSKRLTNNLVETNLDKLRVVSSEVSLSDVSLTSRIDTTMMSVYDKLGGRLQGMAAIQVGLPYRAILLRYVKGEDPIIAYNPVILFKFGKKKSNEGCLSEGDSRFIVKRPRLMKVRYRSKYGYTFTKWLTYKKARIFMHECDHLDGILLTDIGVKVEGK